MADVLQGLPESMSGYIAGAAFFADPYFNSKSWSSRTSDGDHDGAVGLRAGGGPRPEYRESLRGKVSSYCYNNDPVCGLYLRLGVPFIGDQWFIDAPRLGYFDDHKKYNDPSVNKTGDAAERLAALAGAPPDTTSDVPLDLVFAIDTTGSMGSVIGSVKSNVTDIVNTISSTSTDARFALVDYKDAGDPYQAQVDLGFTTSASAFATAVDGLYASGGGDYPESVYSGMMTALNLPWRSGVRKVVITIGDAPGKDPEPVTGYTLQQVVDRAFAVDPAQIYALTAPGSGTDVTDFMQAVADGTGGQVEASSTDVAADLQDLISEAGAAPTADAGPAQVGRVNQAISFAAGGSSEGSSAITAYDWDWNGDGTYDTTVTAPASPYVEHTYTAAGHYDITLRVRSAGCAHLFWPHLRRLCSSDLAPPG